MKRYIIIIIAIITCLVYLSGCESWLDVSPKSTLKKEDLFKTEQGFLDVLQGVYINLVNDKLYGQELSYGFIDVLAQYYDNIPATPQHTYNSAAKYDYSQAKVKSLIDGIWSDMYNAIANCNVILDNIDKDTTIFTENNYKRIKAEALGIRAFLHFDLLRMFAPAYSNATKGQTGIPYVDKFTNVKIPFSSIETVCQRIDQDLEQAKGLLHDFDIMGPVDETLNGVGIYPVNDRKAWMNYYAAVALQARLYQWMGNRSEALERVEELITDHAKTKISWAQSTQFYYYYYANERIFGLFIVLDPYMKAKIAEDFDITTANSTNILKVSLERTMELFETSSGGASDWRYLEWMSKTDDNYIIKYNAALGIQIMKIPEIYLIAAECNLDTDPEKAKEYLDELRTHRGLLPLSENADLAAELHKEYRKEFLCEGQMFYYYKRMGYQYIPYWGEPAGNNIYVLPIPENEIEFNNPTL
jgi:hypothetical protein